MGAVLFHCSINLPYEEVRGVEADSARQKPETENGQEGVTKVEHGWNEVLDFQLREKGERSKMVESTEKRSKLEDDIEK